MSTVSTTLTSRTLKKVRSASFWLLLCGLFLMPFVAQGQPTEIIFSAPGNHSFTVPAGITSIEVQVIGAGGRGGFRTTGNNLPLAGGGGGAYAQDTFTVTPGETFDLYVGIGATSQDPGEDTWFDSTTSVMAKGGESVVNNSNDPGAGGSAADSIGAVTYSGGYGAGGVGASYGGGGGASGTATGDGAYADDTTVSDDGATGATGGGNGGDGAMLGIPGVAGAVPGGGGGGGFRAGNLTSQNPGNGASGRVTIIYNCGVSNVAFAAGASSTRCSAAEAITYTATATGARAIASKLRSDRVLSLSSVITLAF